MNIKLASHSPENTFKIGVQIGSQLRDNEIIYLMGELGAGKTQITKGIAQSMGIQPDEVVSPSYTLVNEYQIREKNQFEAHRLIHVDLYRLGPSSDFYLPEIDDYVNDGIIVVEWAQFLPKSYFELSQIIKISFSFDNINDNHRWLEIETPLTSILF